ncbi:TPA: hypothetical protein DCY65_05415, partial [Candidatus Acetothermia bacterium]|nr:hypothetical protein [Candidatus Acetothermia bacterium]
WTRKKGEAVLDSFQRYHPQLVIRTRQGLAAGRYRDGFPRHEEDATKPVQPLRLSCSLFPTLAQA